MKNRNKPLFFAIIACAAAELAALVVAVVLDLISVGLIALICCGVCVFFACRVYPGGKTTGISEKDYLTASALSSNLSSRKPRCIAGRVIIAVLLLANINFGINDFLPDFIAYFLLAKAFSYAADRAPYFSEVKTGFRRLGWITLMKIPALIIATISRTGNAVGYDWNAVMSLTFAVIELIFTIPVITNLFAGLFRLGERGTALTLIKNKRRISPDTIRLMTYALVVMKCAFSAIPDFFRLTKMAEDGIHLTYVTVGYPISILITQFIGIPFGLTWMIAVIKYVKSVKKEGQFIATIDAIAANDSITKIEKQRFIAALRSVMTALCVASFFSFELRLYSSENRSSNFDGFNIIPHFVYGIVLLVASLRLIAYTPGARKRGIIISSSIYIAIALAIMALETHFLYYYGYDELSKSGTAAAIYLLIEMLSLIELVSAIFLIVCIARALKRFIYFHTAIYPTSERYSRADRDYHRALLRRNYFLMSLGILAATLRCLGVFSRGSVQSIIVQTPGVATLTFLPSMPWITLVIAVGSLSLIGFSIYFFTTMKEEITMKYHEESF